MKMMRMVLLIRQNVYAKYSIADMSYVNLTQSNKEAVFFTERLIGYEFQCSKTHWLRYIPFAATFPTLWFPLQKVLVFWCILRTNGDISLNSIKYLIFVMLLEHFFCEDACKRVNE